MIQSFCFVAFTVSDFKSSICFIFLVYVNGSIAVRDVVAHLFTYLLFCSHVFFDLSQRFGSNNEETSKGNEKTMWLPRFMEPLYCIGWPMDSYETFFIAPVDLEMNLTVYMLVNLWGT